MLSSDSSIDLDVTDYISVSVLDVDIPLLSVVDIFNPLFFRKIREKVLTNSTHNQLVIYHRFPMCPIVSIILLIDGVET